jgi:hypothetical protein
MDTPELATPTTNITIGESFCGGFTTGRIFVDRRPFLLITAPKAEGLIAEVRWGNLKRVDGATSFYDGLANTRAMADAGSKVAAQVLALRISGFDDWYIPSRDEMELQYRAFKPTKDKNWVYRNGDNPSSDPPGYPYTEASPAQTAIEAFRKGGAEAFDAVWHLTSTQCEGDAGCAWIQGFADGAQDFGRKGLEYHVRAVRRIAL